MSQLLLKSLTIKQDIISGKTVSIGCWIFDLKGYAM